LPEPITWLRQIKFLFVEIFFYVTISLMKTIIKSESIQEFKSYFDNLSNVIEELTLWQVNSSTNEREIVKVKYHSYNFELDILSFTHSRPELSFFENVIYFYSSELKFIFKGKKSKLNKNKIQVYIPNEITVLDDSEIDSFSASLHIGFNLNEMSEHTIIEGVTESFTDEKYEQSHRDKDIFETVLRFISLDDEDAPRDTVQKVKMITMKVQGRDQDKETHELFDLSHLDLGVICFNEERYKSGDIIEIHAFDSNVLDAPMLSIVRSVREADETRTSFKIRMQFYYPR